MLETSIYFQTIGIPIDIYFASIVANIFYTNTKETSIYSCYVFLSNTTKVKHANKEQPPYTVQKLKGKESIVNNKINSKENK